MPLVDPFGREITYLRVSVTDRCNLKCTYCMPQDAHHVDRAEVLTFEELERVVRVAVSLGWSKVRLTGGEPLVRKDLPRLVEALARLKQGPEPRLRELVMTTNGLLLGRFAGALAQAGLDRVNVSLDTLEAERFHRITMYDRLDSVLEGIDAAVQAGLAPVKLNTVLIRGSTEDEFPRFVELARRQPVDVRFIEFMPFAGNSWSRDQVLPSGDLKRRIETEHPLEPVASGRDAGPARTFRGNDWAGSVSFISPMSDPDFCQRCNRVRLTSEGRLRGCLLNENEMDFRAALRAGASDEKLASLFRHAIRIKPEEHPFQEDLAAGTAVGPEVGRGMYRIGG